MWTEFGPGIPSPFYTFLIEVALVTTVGVDRFFHAILSYHNGDAMLAAAEVSTLYHADRVVYDLIRWQHHGVR